LNIFASSTNSVLSDEPSTTSSVSATIGASAVDKLEGRGHLSTHKASSDDTNIVKTSPSLSHSSPTVLNCVVEQPSSRSQTDSSSPIDEREAASPSAEDVSFA
jgi:hypothetical protein